MEEQHPTATTFSVNKCRACYYFQKCHYICTQFCWAHTCMYVCTCSGQIYLSLYQCELSCRYTYYPSHLINTFVCHSNIDLFSQRVKDVCVGFMALEDTVLLVSLADFYIFNKVCQMAITCIFVFDDIMSVHLYTYVCIHSLLEGGSAYLYQSVKVGL